MAKVQMRGTEIFIPYSKFPSKNATREGYIFIAFI